MAFDSKIFLKNLTTLPGVYQMLDPRGQVLYVGKAGNLRNRVSSYFRKTGLTPKTTMLVSRIHSVDVTVTETEVEALILEQNLIKQYRPPFNILLRDDKSYPYIFLATQDDFPRISVHRGAKRSKGMYFGPYPSASSVRESLGFLQKTFKIRQCEDSFYKNRTRPCLQYQINRCTAPCVGLISKEHYARDVRRTQMFLEGKNQPLMRELEGGMDEAVGRLAFEEAAACRDQIAALREVQALQVIESGRGSLDVVASAVDGGEACVHILYIRHGRILGSRSFYPKIPLDTEYADVLAEFVPQHYLKMGGVVDIPGEIILSESLADKPVLEKALSSAAKRRVELKSPLRGTRVKWLDLAKRTAEQNLTGRLAAQRAIDNRFSALCHLLGLAQVPERMECFDISHSSGEATVASCVVFNREGPLKTDYRRFNISGIQGGDDYAAMEQALRRRYIRLRAGEAKLPDVLFIDGGKGQLRVARKVLDELDIKAVTLVGVAKGTSRKPGLETLLLSTIDTEREIVPDAASLLLIQQIRDEAHRFAITGHRQRRDRQRRTSVLDRIPGVGPRRRRELLRFFGGSSAVAKASVADLMRVPTINRKVAETIYSILHNE